MTLIADHVALGIATRRNDYIVPRGVPETVQQHLDLIEQGGDVTSGAAAGVARHGAHAAAALHVLLRAAADEIRDLHFPPGDTWTIFAPSLMLQMVLVGSSFVGMGLLAEYRSGVSSQVSGRGIRPDTVVAPGTGSATAAVDIELDHVVKLAEEIGKLEVNAGGQYRWIGDETGAPLTGRLADLLTRRAS